MIIRPSRHARDQMLDREITEEQIRETISSPTYVDQNTKARPGRRFHRRFGDRLLRVVARQRPSSDVYDIVTVIWKGEDDE